MLLGTSSKLGSCTLGGKLDVVGFTLSSTFLFSCLVLVPFQSVAQNWTLRNHTFHTFRLFVLYNVPITFFDCFDSRKAYPFWFTFPFHAVAIFHYLIPNLQYCSLVSSVNTVGLPIPAWCYGLCCHVCCLRLPVQPGQPLWCNLSVFFIGASIGTSSMCKWKSTMGSQPYTIIISDMPGLTCLVLWIERRLKDLILSLLMINRFKGGHLQSLVYLYWTICLWWYTEVIWCIIFVIL